MKKLLETVVENCRDSWRQGHVATYIPELAKARADATGIAVWDLSSGLSGAGDTDFTFTMQSVSKVVSLALALSECGEEKVFSAVGWTLSLTPLTPSCAWRWMRPTAPTTLSSTPGPSWFFPCFPGRRAATEWLP